MPGARPGASACSQHPAAAPGQLVFSVRHQSVCLFVVVVVLSGSNTQCLKSASKKIFLECQCRIKYNLDGITGDIKLTFN